MPRVLAVGPVRIQVRTPLGKFSICHLYANVMFYILFLSEFFVQNIFKLFEDIQNKNYITSMYLRGI